MTKYLIDTHQVELTQEQKDFSLEAMKVLEGVDSTIRLINGRGSYFTFGLDNVTVIAFNSAFNNAPHTDARPFNFSIGGITLQGTNLLASNDDAIIIKSDEGICIAQYSEKYKEVKVLFDLYGLDSVETQKEVLNALMPKIKQAIEETKYKNSWLKGNKDKLVEFLIKAEKDENERNIRSARATITDSKEKIERFKREIISYSKQYKRAMEELERYTSGTFTSLVEKVKKEFDYIAAMPRVTELKIEDKYVHVHIGDVYAYHDQTDERYYIGDFILKFHLESADLRFNNTNNRRRSHWGDDCSHPHVDEETWGYACLGNIESTIAQLISDREYYALVNVMIDFLETVNTDDVAGKNIRNWDVVDEGGNIIREARYVEMCTCERCDDDVEEDDMREIITGINSYGNATSTIDVCDSCLDEYYFDEDSDAWYDYDTYEELEEQRREEGRFDIVTEVDEDGDIVSTERYTEDEAEDAGITYLYDDELGEYVDYDVHLKLEEIRNAEEGEE